jgi:hypothetical protein
VKDQKVNEFLSSLSEYNCFCEDRVVDLIRQNTALQSEISSLNADFANYKIIVDQRNAEFNNQTNKQGHSFGLYIVEDIIENNIFVLEELKQQYQTLMEVFNANKVSTYFKIRR